MQKLINFYNPEVEQDRWLKICKELEEQGILYCAGYNQGVGTLTTSVVNYSDLSDLITRMKFNKFDIADIVLTDNPKAHTVVIEED